MTWNCIQSHSNKRCSVPCPEHRVNHEIYQNVAQSRKSLFTVLMFNRLRSSVSQRDRSWACNLRVFAVDHETRVLMKITHLHRFMSQKALRNDFYLQGSKPLDLSRNAVSDLQPPVPM